MVSTDEKLTIAKEIVCLLDLAAQIELSENYDDLFSYIEKSLDSCYKNKPLIVFSIPDKVVQIKWYRTIWNKQILANNYDMSFIDDHMMKVIPAALIDKHHCRFSFGKEEYLFFTFGCSDGQKFIGMFGEREGICFYENLFGHFVSLMQNFFSIVNKWKAAIEASYLVNTDDVTALYNQRKLYIDLDRSIKKFEIKGEKFAVIFIDIDHFKEVNDGHGHLVGTMLLVKMAKVLKNVMRESDFIYRYGGDEFVIIVPNADKDVAIAIGRRLLNTIKTAVFKIRGGEIYKLSTSIGIAEFPTSAKTREDILDIADKMMYHAKTCGRGKVCMAGELFE